MTRRQKIPAAAALLCAVSLALSLLAQAPPKKPPAGKSTAQKQSKSDPAAEALDRLLVRGERANEDQKHAEALEPLQQYLAQRPADAYAHFQLGYAFTGLQRWDDARREYETALGLNEALPEAHMNLGLVLMRSDAAAAAPHFARAAQLMPGRARPHHLHGTALQAAGKLSEAVEAYRAALALDARKYQFHLSLAGALLAAGRAAEAESAFRDTLRLNPDYPPIHLGLAESLIAQRKTPEAAAAMDGYLALNLGDRESRIQLASLFRDLQDFDKSLAELDRADAGLPAPLPRSLTLRIELLILMKDYAAAAARVREAIAASPHVAQLHAMLGRLLLETRDFPAAERALLEALRLDPAHREAPGDLASAYFLGERYAAALAVLDGMNRREPLPPGAWFIRAVCYDKLGQKKEALDAYRKFVELDSRRDADQHFKARQRIRALSLELEKR